MQCQLEVKDGSVSDLLLQTVILLRHSEVLDQYRGYIISSHQTKVEAKHFEHSQLASLQLLLGKSAMTDLLHHHW